MLAYKGNVAMIAENREDLTACAEQLLIDRGLSSTARVNEEYLHENMMRI